MPINRQTCYIAYCDGCSEACEGDDYIHHSPTEEEAKENAENYDWWFWKDKVWCSGCLPACKCGHLFGEHDYGEASCQDCPCPEYTPVEKNG